MTSANDMNYDCKEDYCRLTFPAYIDMLSLIGCDSMVSPLDCSTVRVVEEFDAKLPPAEDSGVWYELFSIMMHSGSANGGHYSAYVK